MILQSRPIRRRARHHDPDRAVLVVPAGFLASFINFVPAHSGRSLMISSKRLTQMSRLIATTLRKIEVGTGLSPRSPLRTGRADLPYPALQSVVCSVTEAREFCFSGV